MQSPIASGCANATCDANTRAFGFGGASQRKTSALHPWTLRTTRRCSFDADLAHALVVVLVHTLVSHPHQQAREHHQARERCRHDNGLFVLQQFFQVPPGRLLVNRDPCAVCVAHAKRGCACQTRMRMPNAKTVNSCAANTKNNRRGLCSCVGQGAKNRHCSGFQARANGTSDKDRFCFIFYSLSILPPSRLRLHSPPLQRYVYYRWGQR